MMNFQINREMKNSNIFVSKRQNEKKSISSIGMQQSALLQYTPPPPVEIMKKKSFKVSKILVKNLKPLNLENEKLLFFSNGCQYNPQFQYEQIPNLVIDLISIIKDHQILSIPHVKYFDVAMKIIHECIKQFGSEQQFTENNGGELLDQQEVTEIFRKYIDEQQLQDLITFEFEANTVAPTRVIHNNQTNMSRVVIGLPILYRRNTIQGVLDHEIGTHFLRKHNDKKQVWYKKRNKFNLQPHIKNEEGLAVLNQNVTTALNMQQKPFLFIGALHYLSAMMASQLSFCELYHKLGEIVQDPDKRFRECVRVKRGMTDTSSAGGMYKDQVYLIGALKVLKARHKVNFSNLHSGKITVKDCIRLSEIGLINQSNSKQPIFLGNMDSYRKALDRIAEVNFLN